MHVAIYIRVSTERQADEGVSRADQVLSLKNWACANGHQVIDIYEDASTARDDRRPSFQKMVDEAVSVEHPYDAIAVHSQSRFFRDHIAFAIYERKLNKAGVDVISITQPVAKDSSGKMVRAVLSVFDEYQSEENGKHVIRCMRKNAEEGYYNGSLPPFGYQTISTEKKARSGFKKKLVIDAREAELVTLIFDLVISGRDGEPYSLKKIAEFLNKTGLKFRGRPWRLQKLSVILSDTVYIGKYVFNRYRLERGEKN